MCDCDCYGDLADKLHLRTADESSAWIRVFKEKFGDSDIIDNSFPKKDYYTFKMAIERGSKQQMT